MTATIRHRGFLVIAAFFLFGTAACVRAHEAPEQSSFGMEEVPGVPRATSDGNPRGNYPALP